MKVKINTNLGGHDKGTTIDVTPKTADYLISSGVAEAVKPGPKPAPKKTTGD